MWRSASIICSEEKREFFVLPEAVTDAEMELLPGLDGRKMSKSYDNVIPLFEGGERALREAIARIVTDSRLPGEPKEPEGTALVAIYDAFATARRARRLPRRAARRTGLGRGQAAPGRAHRGRDRPAARALRSRSWPTPSTSSRPCRPARRAPARWPRR